MYLFIGGHMMLPIASFHKPQYLLSNCNVTSSTSFVLCIYIHIYSQTLSGMDLGCSWLQWKFGELKGGCAGRCYPRGLSRFVVWVLVNGWLACKMVQQIRLCIHICVCCQYLSMVKSSNFHANIIFLRCTCMHIELYMLHQRFV